jgi:hypothetical protein
MLQLVKASQDSVVGVNRPGQPGIILGFSLDAGRRSLFFSFAGVNRGSEGPLGQGS